MLCARACGAQRERRVWGSGDALKKSFTCVSELLIPVDGENNQQVAQDVHHDGEDEHTPQGAREPRRTAEWELLRGQRGNVR